jgi:hypothetical protein
MSSYRRFHWRAFNVLFRMTAAWFVIVGVYGVLSTSIMWRER